MINKYYETRRKYQKRVVRRNEKQKSSVLDSQTLEEREQKGGREKPSTTTQMGCGNPPSQSLKGQIRDIDAIMRDECDGTLTAYVTLLSGEKIRLEI